MSRSETRMETFSYDDGVVKMFITATLIWGAVAFLLGVVVALEMANWKFNLGLEWFTFGRLRPLHTNAAIFAFGGNAIFAGIYHSSQRLLKARLFSDFLSRFHFWGWQLIIVAAALTLPLGITSGKEYAELEWPIDIAIAIVWVVFAVNFFGTLVRRRERHLYVAIWFYIATIVTVAVLHLVNSMALPVSLFKSYSLYAGAQDALVQWWYGHNAVAFFLTTPFLGLMYYYVPKVTGQPVYSYRLSIVHFWSLVFLYIWAGPHHLLNSAVPDWAQTLGMIFSLMLIAPSWGGMINGLLTIRPVWNRVRQEPILKFFVAAITAYGMSTFEGPLLSIKSVNGLTHYTDYIIGHVHGGTLGWNAFLIAGLAYYMVPKLWNTKLYSERLANVHFWVGLLGILLYVVSMWAAGLTQGMMWRAVDSGGKLVYPDFVETVMRIAPLYWIRALGGLLFLGSYLVMLYNIWKTVAGAPKSAPAEVFSAPALRSTEVTTGESHAGKVIDTHKKLEGLPAIFSVLVVISILVGTLIEILPAFMAHEYVPANSAVKPYTGLELAGRDIYVREGCYTCHSQMIRQMAPDVLRFGAVSKLEDSQWDHPFQWGSRRIGPDLARVGGKYPDLWHYKHMIDPRSMNPNSLMPTYGWLLTAGVNYEALAKKLSVMKSLGVPYSDQEISGAAEAAKAQAEAIAQGLIAQGVPEKVKDKELLALIAYLQILGKQTGGQ